MKTVIKKFLEGVKAITGVSYRKNVVLVKRFTEIDSLGFDESSDTLNWDGRTWVADSTAETDEASAFVNGDDVILITYD